MKISPQELLSLDSRFQTITDFAEGMREDFAVTSLDIPCKTPPNQTYPNVIRDFVGKKHFCCFTLKNHAMIFRLLPIRLQGYTSHLALLDKTYFTDKSNPTTFKSENMQFVSDLNLVYPSVKGAVLQAFANFNAGLKVYFYRLKPCSKQEIQRSCTFKETFQFFEQNFNFS